MIVTITAENKTAIGNTSKAIVFKWNMTIDQLYKLANVANELVEDK